MSRQQNRELFKITRHALSTALDTTFITTECIKSADGLKLWETLEQRFKPLPKDEIEKIDFQTEFTKLSRHPNETHENFLIRFDKFVSEMAYFSMKPSTLHQVLVFLDGLKEPLLGDPICTIRQDPTSIYANWIVTDNLQHTLQKAQSFLKQKQKYVIVPPTSRPGGKGKKIETRPPDQSTDQKLDTMKSKFTTALKNAENPIDAIFEFRNKNRRGCYFHGDHHKFFKCRLVEHLCEKQGFADNLNEAIRRSDQSTQTMLRDRGIEPDSHNTPNSTANATARRTVTTPNQPPPAIRNHQAPTPQCHAVESESEHDYDSGSSYSHTSVNNNNRVDPYSNSNNVAHSNIVLPYQCTSFNKNSNLHSKLIHNSTKISCNKHVTFHPDITTPPSSNTYDKCGQPPCHKQKLELSELPHVLDREKCIPDSGCTHDMSSRKELFEYIHHFKQPSHAILGDDKSSLNIIGYGMMNYFLNGKRIRRIGYYVPELGTTLLSIRQHMKYQGCYFFAAENKVTLAYPTTCVYPSTEYEFELNIQPASHSTLPYAFDETTAVTVKPQKRRKYTIIPQTMTPHITESVYSQHSAEIRVKKLIPEASTPIRATKGSIGFDARSINEVLIPPHSVSKVGTGLSMAIPKGFYLRIADRSSLATKGLIVRGGVVDNDYRGEVIVALCNTTNTPIKVPARAKVAQFIFEKAGTPCITITDQLDTTTRGTKGFGSTTLRKESVIINRLKMIAAVRKARKEHFLSNVTLHSLDSNDTVDDHLHVHTPDLKFLSKHSKPLPSSSPTSEKQSHSSPSLLHPSHSIHKLPIEKVNNSIPKHISMNRDFISQATGFYNTNTLIKHFNSLSQPTVSLSAIDKNPVLDEGEAATINARRRNTKPSQPPRQYSQIWHMDIGYGPTTSVGGFRYTLLLVDKATRYKKMYPLTNLKTSVLQAMKKFIAEVGVKPTLLRTDFDHKLLGGDVANYLLNEKIRVEGAPPKRQHQNGLVERNWRSIVTMARNWLRSSMLPAKYWWFALKRAVEISNIMPTKYGSNIATPHESLFWRKSRLPTSFSHVFHCLH